MGVNYKDVHRKIKKKKYYQNNKSKPLLVFGEFTTKAEASNKAPTFTKGGSFVQPFESSLEERPTFSHKPINELLRMKENSGDKDRTKKDNSPPKINLEERKMIIKVGHKNFNIQLTEYLKILECITTSEKLYGKSMHDLKEKLEKLFKSKDSYLLERDDQETEIYEIEALSHEEITFLKKKFGNHIQSKSNLILPQWKVLKETLSLVGRIHFNCSSFVQQV